MHNFDIQSKLKVALNVILQGQAQAAAGDREVAAPEEAATARCRGQRTEDGSAQTEAPRRQIRAHSLGLERHGGAVRLMDGLYYSTVDYDKLATKIHDVHPENIFY